MTNGYFDPCSTTYEQTVITPGGSKKTAQCDVSAFINASGMATLKTDGPDCTPYSNQTVLNLQYNGT